MAKLRRPEIYDTTSPVRELASPGAFKERPNVEVLHAVYPIEIVKGSALAEGQTEKVPLAHVADMMLSLIEIFEVIERQSNKPTEVVLIDGLE